MLGVGSLLLRAGFLLLGAGLLEIIVDGWFLVAGYQIFGISVRTDI